MTLVAGKAARIPCLYGGYPIDKIAWKQNGSEIDTKKNNSRFKILPNGTLQIEAIKTDTDKGHYTCVVSNRKGEFASGTVAVDVLRMYQSKLKWICFPSKCTYACLALRRRK
jgi:hypothetical protein